MRGRYWIAQHRPHCAALSAAEVTVGVYLGGDDRWFEYLRALSQSAYGDHELFEPEWD